MMITERQQKLIEFINSLDETKRHVIKITLRGKEPWQIEEYNTITKIDLKPLNNCSGITEKQGLPKSRDFKKIATRS